MKNRKEKILCNKKQSTEESTEQPTEQSTVQSTVQFTVQSNYIYGVGVLAVLPKGVCIFYTNKKAGQVIHE